MIISVIVEITFLSEQKNDQYMQDKIMSFYLCHQLFAIVTKDIGMERYYYII